MHVDLDNKEIDFSVPASTRKMPIIEFR